MEIRQENAGFAQVAPPLVAAERTFA